MDPHAVYIPTLEQKMQEIVDTTADAPQLLHGMLCYHLGWMDEKFQPSKTAAGKRIRPILLLLACEAQGGAWKAAIPAAAAIELLHNFSLIHDDIEDQDETRRGRATLWALWGQAQAINAGDALYTLAYRALLDLDDTVLPVARIIAACRIYTDTILRLTQGQAMDIHFETEKHISERAYMTMISHKTAALLGLSCQLGGLIAGAQAPEVAALCEFGESLGMAFQVQDDLLGLWGDPARTGKPVGSDLLRRKKSLPILHGLANSERLRQLLERPTSDTTIVNEALDLLTSVGSQAYATQTAAFYHEKAMQALEQTHGQGEAHIALKALAQRLLNRNR